MSEYSNLGTDFISVAAVLAVLGLIAIIAFNYHAQPDYNQTDVHIDKNIIDKWYDQRSYFIRTSDYNVYETSVSAWNKVTVGKNYTLCITFTSFTGRLKDYGMIDSSYVYDVIPISYLNIKYTVYTSDSNNKMPTFKGCYENETGYSKSDLVMHMTCPKEE